MIRTVAGKRSLDRPRRAYAKSLHDLALAARYALESKRLPTGKLRRPFENVTNNCTLINEVMRRLDHGVWSAWRRHTLPESTWLGSIIPAITDDMGGPNFGHASSPTPNIHLLSVLQEPDVDLRRITDAIGRARQQVCHMGCS